MMTFKIGLAAVALLAQGQPVDADRLGWLTGSWEARTVQAEGVPPAWTEEHWTRPRAGMLVGIGRRGQGMRPGLIEFMTIKPDGEGALMLEVVQSGEPGATRFRLVRSGAAEAVFENPAHDYPQRISYRREGNRLIAAIARLDGTDERSWTFDAQPAPRRAGRPARRGR